MSDVTLEVRLAAIEAFISSYIVHASQYDDARVFQDVCNELLSAARHNRDNSLGEPYEYALRFFDNAGIMPNEDAL